MTQNTYPRPSVFAGRHDSQSITFFKMNPSHSHICFQTNAYLVLLIDNWDAENKQLGCKTESKDGKCEKLKQHRHFFMSTRKQRKKKKKEDSSQERDQGSVKNPTGCLLSLYDRHQLLKYKSGF